MLLSDEKVRKFLKEDVIPVWESVRPAPKITIDFGNGQVLERTLKGNTILWLCDSNGSAVDAFPGIYVPSDFLNEVRASLATAKSGDAEGYSAWHKSRLGERLQVEGRSTMAKAYVETPLLDAIGALWHGDDGPHTARTIGRIDMDLSKLPLDKVYESLSTRILDASDRPASPDKVRRDMAQSVARGKSTGEQLEKAIVKADSRQSLALFRPAVHLLLALQKTPATPAKLRDRVFREILHLDPSDPYLGLGSLAIPGTPKLPTVSKPSGTSP